MNRMSFAKVVLLCVCVFFVATPLFAEVAGRFAEITGVQGTVLFRKGGSGEWKGAAKGMFLIENDEIKTGDNSTAELSLDTAGETGKIDMAPNTQMRIETMKQDLSNEEKTTLLDLALGRVLIKAEKLKGHSSFQVKTPTSICGVRGTLFEVTVEAK